MSRIACSIILVGWLSASVLGGTVTFEPDSRTVDPRTGPTTTTFQISVTAADLFEQITSIRLILGSNDLLVAGFDFDAAFSDHFDSVFNDAMGTEVYASGVNLEAINFTFPNRPALELPAVVGTLTVDAAGLASGSYAVEVNAATDGGRSVIANATLGGETEALVGSATVTVAGGPAVDTDGDGTDDSVDPDDDNDGIDDTQDDFPVDPTETTDTDGDGTGDNADADDDNDGVEDVNDAFPLDPSETADSDGDGIGDNADAGGADANTGPRATGGICGMGMIAGGLYVLLGLTSIRVRRLRRGRH